jgi:benzoate-CoA ligase family protein
MSYRPPPDLNIAEYFLDARVTEGLGDRRAVLTDDARYTYAEIQALANKFGNLLRQAGVEPEQRVIIGLPDGVEFVAALFGILKIGAVVVMVNPDLQPEAIKYFLNYTRARLAIVHEDAHPRFASAAQTAPHLDTMLVVGRPDFADQLKGALPILENFSTHCDDAAIWLFSGGTTGQPKAVVQTHRSFANTTECYAKQALGYKPEDITLSVPKLFFGYATGSNLFFPFAVGASTVLFPDRCTADALFERINRFRPTILVNVPTMIDRMVNHPSATDEDLSCLRFATSAGEALPIPLHERWNEQFGVELLDGLGTAEMWHIFISNRPGDVHPGTLGKVVPGFEVRVCDDHGDELPDGEIGWLWVRGGSRAIGYWQAMEKTQRAFRGEWYVSGDMVCRNSDGTFVYWGRSDDMLKVSGKWLSPQEVESCLREHPAVEDVAVVGIQDGTGLVKPHAFVVTSEPGAELGSDLQEFARQRLDPYKYPRAVVFLDALPRTHLGKVDRGQLRRDYSP